MINRSFKISLLIIFCCTIISAQKYIPDQESIQRLKSNLTYLASDKLKGREATTEGEKLASEFIVEKLKEYGVKPFGDGDSYFQEFEVQVDGVDTNSTLQFISANDEVSDFHPGKDFYLSSEITPDEEYNNIDYEVVFAGFGISSDNEGYDDYENIDVENKVVLILNGTPRKYGGKIFSKDDDELFGSTAYKIDNAEKHGASGMLVLPVNVPEKYWKWMSIKAVVPQFKLAGEEHKSDRTSIPFILLSHRCAELLMEKEKFSFEEMIGKFINDDVPEWFPLSKKVRFNYTIYSETRTARNIVGVIEGNDEELKDEYVSLGAHYDHLGIFRGEIYNGADDNASGTCAVLETARKLKLLKKNKRTILIVLHTCEEKGLLGSKYFTSHCDFIDDIVANINIDMVGRESIDTIYSVGSDKISPELKKIVEDVNKETVGFVFNYRFDDPSDPERIYYRSDHYNYAKHGIPIVFFYDFMNVDYHKPTDDPDKINYEKIDKVTDLVSQIALRISDLPHRMEINNEEMHSHSK